MAVFSESRYSDRKVTQVINQSVEKGIKLKRVCYETSGNW